MKFIILFCLLGAALALFDDKWKMKKNVVPDSKNGVGGFCANHVDCSPLCKLTCNPLQYVGVLCQEGECFCKVQPTPKN